MSDIVKGTIRRLLSWGEILSRVAQDADRNYYITPNYLPQGCDYPAVYVQLVNVESDEHLNGASGIASSRVQINCYARTSIEASALREEIRLCLQGYRGPMGDETVRSCSQVGKYDLYEEPRDGSKDGLHIAIIEFEIAHFEAIPSF